MSYGKEFILDMVGCLDDVFDRDTIGRFLVCLCDDLGVTREELHWWDYSDQDDERSAAPPHMAGVSAVQFISKSTVVIHTIDDGRLLMLNVFSCGDFDVEQVERIALNFFGGKVVCRGVVERGSTWSAS